MNPWLRGVDFLAYFLMAYYSETPRHRANELLDECIRWLVANPDNTACAGSLALWYWLERVRGEPQPWVPNDGDVFMLARRPIGTTERHFALAPPPDRVCDPPIAFTTEHGIHNLTQPPVFRIMDARAPSGGKIQFVLSNLFADVEELFASFDLTAAMVAIVIVNGAPTVVVGKKNRWPDCVVRLPPPLPGFERKSWSNVYSDDERFTLLYTAARSRTLERVKKYQARGMTATPTFDPCPHPAVFAFLRAYLPTLLRMADNGSFEKPVWAKQFAERQQGRWKHTAAAISVRT